MNYFDLRAELMEDPEGIGYAASVASGADGDTATLINAPRASVLGSASLAKIQSLIQLQPAVGEAIKSVWVKAKEIAGTPEHPLKDACAEAVELFVSARYDALQLQHPRVQALLDAYVAGGLMTQDQANEVIALGLRTISRAEQLWGAPVGVEDIARALRG